MGDGSFNKSIKLMLATMEGYEPPENESDLARLMQALNWNIRKQLIPMNERIEKIEAFLVEKERH